MLKKLLLCIMMFFAVLFTVNCSADIIKPSANDTHPFVFLSDDFISGLRDEEGNIKKEFEGSYNYFKKLATGDLPDQPSGGYISSGISNKLMARALMYALGEFDYDHARATVEYTLKYLEKPLTSQTYSINMYKDLGTNGIQTGALVYDWCYDAFKEDEKQLIASYIVELYKDTNGDGSPNYNQPARIDNVSSWGDLAGKAVGQPLIYNAIAATALYDIKPEVYNSMMGKIQGNMAKVVKAYGTAGALSDGSISYTREHYSYYVYIILQRFGATDAQLDEIYGDQSPVGYKMMYSRLPYGTYFRYGDNHPNTINVYTNISETTDLGMLASMYRNEYFRHQYIKENYTSNSLLKFLAMDCDVEPKLPDDLPLAYETKSPRTEVMARTSWQDGLNSKTVTVSMNMNERRSGDHDHGDIGSFQLYYKGPLTMPGGIYRGEDWGGTHWRNYYTRSIAANCVTVYMPGEVFKYGNKVAEANDGGQKMAGNKSGGYVIGEYAEHFADTNIWAVTEGTYIGPNAKTPAFSYLKGDITKAYSSDKMQSYKRGMVFMDTFNDTYPGALIVFDRVVSKNASYDKKWLLQSVTDPEISGNKITITNTGDGANGKLVNTTLLPESVNIEKVGGKATYIADGQEWPAPEAVDFSKIPDAYASGYRLEVSPDSENTEDIFLNAMYVTDADGNAAQLPMIKEIKNEFVGVTTLDRMVMFSKSGNFIKNSFSITVRNNNSGGDMLCLITDITPGKWTISGNGKNITIESSEGDNCLVFSVAPGTYTITPASSTASLTSLSWPEAEKEKLGDFVIKFNKSYAYLPEPTYLKDGVPYISAKTAEEFGVYTTVSGNTVTVENWQNKSVITVGQDYYVHNGSNVSVSNQAISHNGTVYIPVLNFKSALGIDCSYVSETLTLHVSKAITIPIDNFIAPKSVTGVENAVVLGDGIIAEKIAFSPAISPYIGTPVTFYYGETVKHFTKIAVGGTYAIGNAKIYTSLDGKNFSLLNVDTYTIDSALVYDTDVYARYIMVNTSASATISEVAAYGTDAEAVCAFGADNAEIFSSSEPLKIQAYIKPGFESAALYLNSNKVCNITEGNDSVYDITVSENELANIPEGTHSLSILVSYNGENYTCEREFVLDDKKDAVKFVDEPINGTSYSKVFGNRGTYNFARNPQNATESYPGDCFKLTFDKQVVSSVPYVSISAFQHGRGVYDINFETEITSPDIHISLELRNKDNKAITSGSSYNILSGLTGAYEITVVADTENSLLRVYGRELGSTEEKVIMSELTITTDSFGQFRFNIINRGDNGSISFDDISVVYKEVGVRGYTEQLAGDKVLLSANAGEADEIIFCINDEEVKRFNSPSEDDIYEYETSFEENGIKYFDTYVKNGNNIYMKSSSFLYNNPSERGTKTFEGPFIPTVQNDGHYWKNLTGTSTYFAGRVVFEGDITLPSTTDRAYFELGGASDYSFKYGGTNYITLSDAPGYGDSSNALFNENGKIANTDYTYSANTPMHIKFVCDTITDTYEFYFDGVKVLTKAGVADAGADKTGNLINAKIVGCKVRLVYRDTDESGDGIPTISNIKTYQEFTLPEVNSVTYDGNDASSNAGYVVPKNAESIVISLSDAYSYIDEESIIVKVDGKDISANTEYNANSKTVTVTDFDLEGGNILEITIPPEATVKVPDVSGEYADAPAGFGLKTGIYIGNDDRICIYPFKAIISSNNLLAYSKYVNASETSKVGSLIMAEYSNNYLKNSSYKTAIFKAGTSGIVSGYLQNADNKENCKVFLWNEDLSQITTLRLNGFSKD